MPHAVREQGEGGSLIVVHMGFRVYVLSICESIMGIESSQRRYPRHRRRGGTGNTAELPADCVYGEETVEAYRHKPLPPLPVSETAVKQPLVDGMTGRQVREVSRLIHNASDHLSYAIGGPAAMLLHGRLDGPAPAVIDVVCSDDALAVFGNWALAKGFRRSVDGDPHDFSLATATIGEGGAGERHAIPVRIRALSYFGDLRVRLIPLATTLEEQTLGVNVKTEAAAAVACVLSLPSIADALADGYVEDLARAKSSSQNQAAVADDMRWVLRSIAASSRRTRCRRDFLSPSQVPHIASDAFWIPFTLSFPDTVTLFEEAGLRSDWDRISPQPLRSPPPPPVVLIPSTPPFSSSFPSPGRRLSGSPPFSSSSSSFFSTTDVTSIDKLSPVVAAYGPVSRRHSVPDSNQHGGLGIPPLMHPQRDRKPYLQSDQRKEGEHGNEYENCGARMPTQAGIRQALRSTPSRPRLPSGDYTSLRDEYRRSGGEFEFLGG